METLTLAFVAMLFLIGLLVTLSVRRQVRERMIVGRPVRHARVVQHARTVRQR